MKIHSQFRDIYDNCAMYGIDEDTVYRRFFTAEAVRMKDDYAFLKPRVASAYRQVRLRLDRYPRERSGCPPLAATLAAIKLMYLVVGRHVIPHFGVLEVRRFITHLDKYDMRLLDHGETRHLALTHPDDIQSALGKAYDSPEAILDGVFEQYEAAGYRQAFRDDMARQLRQPPLGLLTGRAAMPLAELMAPFEDERWATALGAPLAVVMPAVVPVMERRGPRGGGETDTLGALILRNPSVSRLGLASLMEPFTVHQEIMMALNSFLSAQQDGPMAVSDTDMAHAKGFDERSFRTPKGAKKPRRRKPGKDT